MHNFHSLDITRRQKYFSMCTAIVVVKVRYSAPKKHGYRKRDRVSQKMRKGSAV